MVAMNCVQFAPDKPGLNSPQNSWNEDFHPSRSIFRQNKRGRMYTSPQTQNPHVVPALARFGWRSAEKSFFQARSGFSFQIQQLNQKRMRFHAVSCGFDLVLCGFQAVPMRFHPNPMRFHAIPKRLKSYFRLLIFRSVCIVVKIV
jgi:hypothetical protein